MKVTRYYLYNLICSLLITATAIILFLSNNNPLSLLIFALALSINIYLFITQQNASNRKAIALLKQNQVLIEALRQINKVTIISNQLGNIELVIEQKTTVATSKLDTLETVAKLGFNLPPNLSDLQTPIKAFDQKLQNQICISKITDTHFSMNISTINTEEILQQLLEKHDISTYISDQNGNIIRANNNFTKNFKDEAKIKISDFLHNHQNSIAREEFTKGGKNALISQIRAGQNAIFGVITLKKPNDKAVWPEHFEKLPMAIAELDFSGVIRQSNQSFKKLIDMEQNKNKIYDYVKPVCIQKAKECLDPSNKGPSKHIEIELINEKPILIYAAKSDDYITICSTDITEQKKLEFSLLHSQKMQVIGQLAGGIAHDFNNLITAITGFCELLLTRHPPGDQSFPDIIQIKQNANRATNLVRQLLAFSRKQMLQPKIIDITEVLVELTHLIRRLIGEHIALEIIHGQNLGLVKFDQNQLEQIIINARDAMQDGGKLTIKTSNMSSDQANKMHHFQSETLGPGEYILIEVQDTGCGIDKEIINKIFEPFFSTKEAGKGTGLGLSTVYGTIKQAEGQIYVDSKPGEGVIFSIFLKRDNQRRTKTQPQPIQEQQILDLTGKETILLVEDEAAIRACSTTMLTNKGYKVIEAESAEYALKIMENEAIDLIITDVVMPNMSGPQMFEKIAKKYPDIKVIFISGYTEKPIIQNHNNQPNFLSKPFTLKELAIKVKKVINTAV
jgi:nitrogen-specific signal transduction histidine kinase/preprotein translocase subunit YajC